MNDRPGRRRATSSAVVTGAAVVAVAASYRVVRRGKRRDTGLSRFDDVLGLRWRRPRGRVVDRFVAASTDVGSVYGLAGTAAALAATGRRRAALDVAGAGTVAWIAAQATKPLVDRSRPYQGGLGDLLVHPPAGSSWPSGHTAVAAAVGTVVADSGPVGLATGSLAAAWVGWSRIYVGAHHPSDIVAGLGQGTLSAIAWRWSADRARAWWLERERGTDPSRGAASIRR